MKEDIRYDIIPCGDLGWVRKSRMNSISLGPNLGPASYNMRESKHLGRSIKNPLQGGFTFYKQKKHVRPRNASMMNLTAGPGDYDLNGESPLSKHANSKRHGVIARSGSKKDRFSWQTKESPDPGRYQDKVQQFIISPVNIKFTRSSKISVERETSPGPGHYDVK